MPEVITTVTKLLEYDDNSYYAIDYTGAMQQLNDSLAVIALNQQYLIVLIAVLVALVAVFIFVFAFRSHF